MWLPCLQPSSCTEQLFIGWLVISCCSCKLGHGLGFSHGLGHGLGFSYGQGIRAKGG